MLKDLALAIVLKGHNRADPDLSASALEALDRLVPSCDGILVREKLSSLQEDISQTRDKTSSIFDFTELKQIASSLDWNTATRKSRDDSKIIPCTTGCYQMKM